MKKLIALLIVFVFFISKDYAQQTTIDSLKQILTITKVDTVKVNILNELSEATEDVRDILKYATQSLQLAERIDFKNGMGKALENIAYVNINKGDMANALECCERALHLYEETQNNQGAADIFNSIGYIYHSRGDLLKGLEYYQKSLKIQEEIGNKEATALLLNNIAGIYSSQGDYNKVLEYHERSIKINEEIGNKRGISQSLHNIGSVYINKGDYQKALDYYHRSLKIRQETVDKKNIALTLNNIGGAYGRMNRFDDAHRYLIQSLRIMEEINYKLGITQCLYDLGGNFQKQKNYPAAQNYCSRALQLAKEIGNPIEIRNVSRILGDAFAQQGKYKDAYTMHQLFKQMSDSVSNSETRKSTVRKEMQYEFEKKEAITKAENDKKEALAKAEIKRQKLIRNSTFWGVGLAGIFTFLLVTSFNRRRKTSFEKQVSEVEMKALRSQMNPHFIFNSLHSINKYMLDNDKQNASEFLSKFSKVMRLILENSREQEVSLEKDLSALELYIQLEALRFQNKFQYKIEIDPQIDKEATLIPPMILQPFVENSIIHGVRTKEDGMIKIKITKENDMIRCSVEDNGIGREESVKIEASEEKKHESLAMKITQERLNIIRHLKKVKAVMNIFDLKNAENKPGGLRVELLLPFETAF